VKTALLSVATAVPPFYVSQAEAYDIFTTRFRLTDKERELYRKALVEGPIRGRYVGMNSTAEAIEEDQDRLVDRFLAFGRKIAAEAGFRALEKAGLAPADVGTLIVNTCTGYLCPGLTSYVAEALDLPPSVRPLDIMGMGCGAALPNLQAADNAARAQGQKPVLSIAVEICSATLFMDADPGVVISNCIFGDGAAAAVIRCAEPARDEGLLRLVDFENALYPAHRAKLQYRTERHRLRNVLTRQVPVVGARAVRQAADKLLERNKLTRNDIDCWIVHPGGTEVLAAVSREFGISRETLRFSYAIFEEYGNMSSPSVLFVLERMLQQAPPRRGEKGLMLAFGAGFSAFAALVEF
jgi:predicted naringenin-chalcone synthase